MKSCSNSSNKAEKQTFEAKTVTILKYSSLETASDLSLQRLSYKSTEIYLKKKDEAQKPKQDLENKYSQKSEQI